jgi:hypothetical protein
MEAQAQPRFGSWDERTSVHIFVDNSNVTVNAERRVVNVARLAKHLEGGREPMERFVCGSRGHQWEDRWRDVGYTPHFDPRDGPEHFVDDALIAQAQRTADKEFPRPGRIMVLVTGDANENHGRVNFREVVMKALKNNWLVEVHSWKQKCNRWYVEQSHSSFMQGRFRLKYLDDAPRLWELEEEEE